MDAVLNPTAPETELDNFVDIFRRLQPQAPGLTRPGFEIYSGSRPLNGSAGGDHIIHIDFAARYDLDRRIELARAAGQCKIAVELEKNRFRVGVMVADASGHSATDALMTAMLHQAFLTGVLYELEYSGHVTTRLFEILNQRFFSSVSVDRFVTLIYGEISESGSFRFISAGHPPPLVYSARWGRLVEIAPDHLVSFFPLGLFPSEDDVDEFRRTEPAPVAKKRYSVNQLDLMGHGDVLLLFTDGLGDLARDGQRYVATRLESMLGRVSHRSASEIFDAVVADAIAFSEPDDDLSLVVVRRR